MKPLFLILFVLLTSEILLAQSPRSSHTWQPTGFSFRVGNQFLQGNTNINEGDYLNYTDELDVLNDTSKIWEAQTWSNRSGYQLNLDLEFKHYSKTLGEFTPGLSTRIGVDYKKRYLGNITSTNETKILTDTLISSSTGENLYAFNGVRETDYIQLELHELRLDLAVMFNTDETRLLSLYGGLGFQIGSTLSSSILVSSQINQFQEFSYNTGEFFEETFTGFGDFSSTETQVQGPRFINASAYIPLGFNLKLSKDVKVLNRISINTELKIVMDYSANRLFPSSNFLTGVKVRI